MVGVRHFFSGVFFLACVSAAPSYALPTASCQFTGGSSSPKVTCEMPDCPEGIDCTPPLIDRQKTQIDFYEPVIRWKAACGEKGSDLTPGCWEAYFDLRVRMTANDAFGIESVGAQISIDLGNSRTFRQILVKAGARGADGRFDGSANFVVQLPARRIIELGIDMLCARDTSRNETCVLPGN